MALKLPNKYTVARQAGGIGAVITLVLAAVGLNEGGWVDNPKDPGGETNHGITVAVARQNDFVGPMKELTKEQANAIHSKQYIHAPGYDDLLELAPAVGHKVIDAGVNAGTGRSSRWLQAGLNAFNRDGKDYPDLTVDGKVGPATINAYKGLVRVRGKVLACKLMIKAIDIQQGSHYLSLKNLETFTVGWVDHRIGNVPTSDCDH